MRSTPRQLTLRSLHCPNRYTRWWREPIQSVWKLIYTFSVWKFAMLANTLYGVDSRYCSRLRWTVVRCNQAVGARVEQFFCMECGNARRRDARRRDANAWNSHEKFGFFRRSNDRFQDQQNFKLGRYTLLSWLCSLQEMSQLDCENGWKHCVHASVGSEFDTNKGTDKGTRGRAL